MADHNVTLIHLMDPVSSIDLAERYAQMTEDDLAELACSNELIPEATHCLRVELEKRGLTDLDALRKQRELRRAEIMAGLDARIAAHRNQMRFQIRLALLVYGVLMLPTALWKYFGAHDTVAGIGIAIAGTAAVAIHIAAQRTRHFFFKRLIYRPRL